MATTKDTPAPESQEGQSSKPEDQQSFGAYASGLEASPGVHRAVDPEPDSKKKGSMDFVDSDKRWLKDIGITTTNPKDYDKAWASNNTLNQKHRWAETYGGRLAIRSVSRGIVGATFFAIGNMYIRDAMGGYNPNSKLFDNLPDKLRFKPAQVIAKIIDKTVGKTLYSVVKAVSGEEAAINAVTFRPTRSYNYDSGIKHYTGILPPTNSGLNGVTKPNGKPLLVGRSLGHEAMAITFDFAAMSFGDYMTRYVLSLVDPNAKIKWMKDGHVDFPGALKDVLHNLWTGVTYAAGEDMAVAIPYVYGMRLQRNVIDKYSHGFKYDSDRAINGGSFKINEGGQIVGDYQMEGMLDLMGRFSWYNVGTKMFRDAYSHLANSLGNWWQGDRKVGLPHIEPDALSPRKLADDAKSFVRYVFRTVIKVMIYMLPATAFFFITRTPQSKFFGAAIHPEKGVLGMVPSKESGITKFESVRADFAASRKDGKGHMDIVRGSFYTPYSKSFDVPNPFVTELNQPYSYKHRFETFSGRIYKDGNKAPWYNPITNAIGSFCYSMGSALNQLLQGVNKKLLGGFIEGDTINDFSRKYTNAAISYTPYFMAKTDLGSTTWDTKRMDMAIDRMLGGFAHFRVGDVIGGSGEIYRSMVGQPFSDPNREQKAKEAMKRDAERSSNEGFQLVRGRGGDREDDERKNTEEQLFKPAEAKGPFAKEEIKAKRPTLTALRQNIALKPRESGWAAQEAAKAEAEHQNHTIH